MLEWAEVAFDIMVPETDEAFPPEMPVADVPVFIARNKARAVQQRCANRIIVAADTVVVLDNRIIGKPRDAAEAVYILTALSGRRHQVITGVVVLKGERETAFADVTDVWFHPLTGEQIIYYVEKYRPFDKAGAYAIQEWIGVTGIKSISGDFYNVMGLPVSRVVQALKYMD